MMLLLGLLLGSQISSAQGQNPLKRIVDVPLVLDYRVPSTLEEFIEQADAVIVARVRASRDVSQRGRPRTDYEVDLLRVVKGHEKLGAESKACRVIGIEEYANRTVRTYQPRFPAFTPGEKYLLFLSWEESWQCFGPAFGPAGVGVLDLAKGLQPLVEHRVLQSLTGLSEDALEARLRSLAKRHRAPFNSSFSRSTR